MRKGLVCVLFLFLTSTVHAEIFEDKVHRTIPAIVGAKLVLDAEFGDVEVVTDASNQIEIDVYRRVDTRDRAEADAIFQDFQLSTHTSGKEIVVEGVFKNGWKSGSCCDFCHNGECLSYSRKLKKHTYRIQIPKDMSVDLTTWGGDLSIGDLESNVFAFTSGGDIEIGNVGGNVEVDTSGGDIQIGDAAADVEAITSGGDINIRSAHGSVKARTSGGDVNVRLLEQPKRKCQMETHGGDVIVYLPRSAKMNLDAETNMGEVDANDFTITSAVREEDELQGKINGGGPELILRTSAGDIEIRSLPE